MTTSLVIISCLVGGVTGLIAGIKNQLITKEHNQYLMSLLIIFGF